MSDTTLKKPERLRGFAATLANRLELVKDIEEFKEYSKNISVKLLMNPLDGRYAALITIDKGTLKVEGIRNDDPSNLKKKKLGWNAKMAMKLQLFLELASGKISQGKILAMVATGKIKVRGLVYFVILQKLFSFLPDSEESKPKYLEKRTIPFIGAKLFFFAGILHIIIGIIAGYYRLESVPLTAFLFAFFCIWLSIWFNRLVKINAMNETEILIFVTIISILNSLNYLIFILEGVIEGLFFLNIFMYIVLCINFINFLLFFTTKTKLNSMDMDEKLDYFSILLMRGLGMNFFFRFLEFIRSPDPLYLVAVICIIFGLCNIIYGNKIMNNRNIKIQIQAMILVCLSISFAVLVYFFIVPALCMLFNIVLFSVVAVIRIYYVKKKL